MGWYNFGPYVSVAEKKGLAEQLLKRLKKTRPDLQPVRPAGRNIVASFWGQAWCQHLTTYADHENRIERGRSYVRNGAVCHLEAAAGHIGAIVAGSCGAPYEVTVTVKPLPAGRWKEIKTASAGRVRSMLDLLSGRFPKDVMARAADPDTGLFPKLGELKFNCTCPDWAQMCKHVAAVLYAFGHRLDQSPELLFLLRGVDPAELVNFETLAALGDAALAGIFDIELDLAGPETKAAKTARPARRGRPAAPPPTSPAPVPESPAFKNPDRPKGREIAALRRRLKMSQAEFAAALEVSPSTIVRWEKLKYPEPRQNSRDRLLALAQGRERGRRKVPPSRK